MLEGLLDVDSWSPPMPGRQDPARLEGLLGSGSGRTTPAARSAAPRGRKRGRTWTPGPPPPATPPPPGDASSLSFLTAEERRWVSGEVLPGATGGKNNPSP